MSITVEAIYEAGVLKPLTPLLELPEHTKVRITVEVISGTCRTTVSLTSSGGTVSPWMPLSRVRSVTVTSTT